MDNVPDVPNLKPTMISSKNVFKNAKLHMKYTVPSMDDAFALITTTW